MKVRAQFQHCGPASTVWEGILPPGPGGGFTKKCFLDFFGHRRKGLSIS
jgi:hypothetical protein